MIDRRANTSMKSDTSVQEMPDGSLYLDKQIISSCGDRSSAVSCGGKQGLIALFLALVLLLSGLTGCSSTSDTEGTEQDQAASIEQADVSQEQVDQASGTSEAQGASSEISAGVLDASQVPSYGGSPYVEIAYNVPGITEEDAVGVTESYSPLDSLGRCGAAIAVVSSATMPTEERGSIGMIKPSGWHTVRYDDLVDGKYLYNRCHLLGYQLTGENANEENLITGTRYMNVDGMLPFENEVADFVERTDGRVLMRVTPVFVGDELVARGVHMEALSLGDGGRGVSFNVFCYNVQPGVEIDYATGESKRASSAASDSAPAAARAYVLNTNSKKFHYPDCSSVSRMSAKNKKEVTESRDELIAQGYEPCGNCNP